MNINLFAVATVTAEWLPGGGVKPSARIDPIRLISPMDGYGMFVFFCRILFFVFLVYFILREIRNIAEQKWSYWNSYWSFVEWFIILTSISAVVFYFYKVLR